MEILKTEQLTKQFGGLAAVSNVDFYLEENEIQSIIGPNGAGKSTFFKLITGELKPSKGKVWFHGEDITGLDQNLISRKGVATSYQITNIFPKLTTFENLRIAVQSRRGAYMFWTPADSFTEINQRTEDILRQIALWDKRNVLAGVLSYGDQRSLEIGIAVGTCPSLLLLDEPTSGLSPQETREAVALIKEISKGISVILVEHKMKVVMDLSDKITVFHEGQIIAHGHPEEIRANETVRKVYLGGVK